MSVGTKKVTESKAVMVWETIHKKKGCQGPMIHRAVVPSGWLVYAGASNESPKAMIFIPDPEHEWTVQTQTVSRKIKEGKSLLNAA